MSEIVRLPGTAEGPNIWVGGRNNDKLSIPFWFDKKAVNKTSNHNGLFIFMFSFLYYRGVHQICNWAK